MILFIVHWNWPWKTGWKSGEALTSLVAPTLTPLLIKYSHVQRGKSFNRKLNLCCTSLENGPEGKPMLLCNMHTYISSFNVDNGISASWWNWYSTTWLLDRTKRHTNTVGISGLSNKHKSIITKNSQLIYVLWTH